MGSCGVKKFKCYFLIAFLIYFKLPLNFDLNGLQKVTFSDYCNFVFLKFYMNLKCIYLFLPICKY